jgi:peptide/nickel transport system substrate-binding protein
MPRISRRALAGLAGAAALPRFAIGQTDTRPSITVAVQKVSNTNTLDLLREQSNVGERTSSLVTERLVDLDWFHGAAEIPGLAESWRRIDDSTLEMSIRPGVKFHNGDTLTAEDVAYSFSAARMFGDTKPDAMGRTVPSTGAAIVGQGSKALPPEIPPVARQRFPSLARVDVTGPLTVRFVNATPDVTLEGRLAATGSEVISRSGYDKAASWLDFARKPVGTGPYKVREFRPDSMLILDAHDEYWGGRPPIKTLRFVEVPEVSSRINGLLSGEYQFACDIPPDQIAIVEGHAGFEVVGGNILNIRITDFDKTNAQLADPRVRLAFAHAIDRQAIIDALWAGRTRIPPGLQFDYYGDMLIADWRVPEYDPAKAKALLKEAGYKGDAIPYRLLNNYYTNQVATSQVLVEMWRQVGLNVEINMMENWLQIRDQSRPRGVRDWSAGTAFNDPVGSLVSQFGPNGSAQSAGEYTNPEFNRLCVDIQTSTDRPLRKKMFARLLQIAEREDPAYTVLHQNGAFTAKRKDIAWRATPSFVMDFRASNWGSGIRG